jgi:hypothetical protein
VVEIRREEAEPAPEAPVQVEAGEMTDVADIFRPQPAPRREMTRPGGDRE